MVKKFEQLTLLLITVLFAGMMLGLLIARHFGQSGTQLSAYDRTSATATVPDETAHCDATGKLNINFASATELAMLPRIGDGLAQRIVDYRQENGPFMSIDDLIKVNGIGEKSIEVIKEYITVGG